MIVFSNFKLDSLNQDIFFPLFGKNAGQMDAKDYHVKKIGEHLIYFFPDRANGTELREFVKNKIVPKYGLFDKVYVRYHYSGASTSNHHYGNHQAIFQSDATTKVNEEKLLVSKEPALGGKLHPLFKALAAADEDHRLSVLERLFNHNAWESTDVFEKSKELRLKFDLFMDVYNNPASTSNIMAKAKQGTEEKGKILTQDVEGVLSKIQNYDGEFNPTHRPLKQLLSELLSKLWGEDDLRSILA